MLRTKSGWAPLCGGLLLLAAALSSCGGDGGGGGGGGDAGAGGGAPAGSSVTGLLPSATAPGAVLHADATTLLPLRAGTVWHYHGRRDGRYDTGVLVSLAAAGGEFRATRKSTPEADETMTYGTSGGDIVARESLESGTGATVAEVRYTVLRSPVRQGEQITLFDIAGLASGTDIDGDRVDDSADMAAYSRVVGTETVELPDVQRTLSAVRVDTTVRVRFRRSSDGQWTAVASTVDSEWFAAGIGVVRRTTRAATTDGSIGAV